MKEETNLLKSIRRNRFMEKRPNKWIELTGFLVVEGVLWWVGGAEVAAITAIIIAILMGHLLEVRDKAFRELFEWHQGNKAK